MRATIPGIPESTLKSYLGIPVLVQLKRPIVLVGTSGKAQIPFSIDPEKSWHFPEEFNQGEGTMILRGAVLAQTDDPQFLQATWLVPGKIEGQALQTSVLVRWEDVDCIARIDHVHEPSRILAP